MQELWKKQATWDDPLDHDFQSRWYQVASDLEEATKIVLTHRYFPLPSDKPICLHVFADASTKVYDAVAYLQSAGSVAFVMAKFHVLPPEKPHFAKVRAEGHCYSSTSCNIHCLCTTSAYNQHTC